MEFMVVNSDDKKEYDFSRIVSKPEYTTELNNGAGKLTFSYLKNGVMLAPGSMITFRYDDTNIFKGYVFVSENTEDDMLSVTAYDQLRYLKYKDSIMGDSYSLTKLIKEICIRQNLQYGEIEDTRYNQGKVLYKDKTYLDMIYDFIDDILVAMKKKYVLYDDFGRISLKEANNLRLPFIIGDRSLAYGYTFQRSIDNETYNKIKIGKKSVDNDSVTYLDNTFGTEDTKTQAKWGKLQYYEIVDDNMSPQKIDQRAMNLLKLYNVEERKLELKCLGCTNVRAGTSVRVILSNLMIDKYFIVRKASHNFDGVYTMDLELIL